MLVLSNLVALIILHHYNGTVSVLIPSSSSSTAALNVRRVEIMFGNC